MGVASHPPTRSWLSIITDQLWIVQRGHIVSSAHIRLNSCKLEVFLLWCLPRSCSDLGNCKRYLRRSAPAFKNANLRRHHCISHTCYQSIHAQRQKNKTETYTRQAYHSFDIARHNPSPLRSHTNLDQLRNETAPKFTPEESELPFYLSLLFFPSLRLRTSMTSKTINKQRLEVQKPLHFASRASAAPLGSLCCSFRWPCAQGHLWVPYGRQYST